MRSVTLMGSWQVQRGARTVTGFSTGWARYDVITAMARGVVMMWVSYR